MGFTTHTPRISVATFNIEPLEGRNLFAVSMGGDGWTEITPSADTRIVYVSSSAGSDSNGGLSSRAPVKTIAKARTLLRNGSPDQMLLRRGDAWTENLANWKLSGRNSDEPMVIGAYGSGARPKLNTGTTVGFTNSAAVAHLAIMGVHFHAHTRDTADTNYNGTTAGDYGFRSHGPLDNVLIEDAVFDDYEYNLSITGYNATITNFTLRRSIVTDAWSIDGKAQGMYVSKTNRVLLEENLFDHNGWNEDVSAAKANMYSHGIYMSRSNENVVVRGNIISNSSSHGIQARSGGTIENNLFLRNPINLLFGGGSEVKAGGVSGRVAGNVILDSRDISGSGRGTAMDFSNIKSATVVNNIMTADTHRRMAAISFGTAADASNVSQAVGINNLAMKGNIVYDWHSAYNMSSSFQPGGSGYLGVNNLTVQDNDFQLGAIARLVRQGPGTNNTKMKWSGNRYTNRSWFSPSGWFQIGNTTTSYNMWKSKVESSAQSAAATYADPVRSIATYQSSIGQSANLGAFLREARDQANGDFDSRFTAAAVINHVRRGFAENGVVPGGLLELRSAIGTATPGYETPGGVKDTTAPTAPTVLRATGSSSTTNGLTWVASSDNVGVAGYNIFRDGVRISTTRGTTFTDTGLKSGTTYVYRVRAFDAAGNLSPFSNDDRGTTY
ncbi:MAG TPA: right-handed parallel beta-helix repeat-containing protein [Tepidisphaeraceae bacterium]|nr:right-handed parallel beta-helix repeat-containing protein [Tepidisphaeraceae bacterium]